MKYKFIRIGHRPVEESDYDYNIRAGFDACTDEVKDKLEAFFKDAGQQSVTFEFEGQMVEVRRESK